MTVVAFYTAVAGFIGVTLENAGIIPDTPIPEIALVAGTMIFTHGIAVTQFFGQFQAAVGPVTGPGSIRESKWANDLLFSRGFTVRPFPRGVFVANATPSPTQRFVRVHDNGVNARPQGAFIAPASEVEGRTPKEVQARLALPYTPTAVSDVDPNGVESISGPVGPAFGQPGGGVQLYLKDFGATFGPPRPVNADGVFE